MHALRVLQVNAPENVTETDSKELTNQITAEIDLTSHYPPETFRGPGAGYRGA